MNHPTKPKVKPHEPFTEYPTPTKSKVQGAVEFLEAKGLLGTNQHAEFSKHDVYDFFGVKDRTGSKMLHHNPDQEEEDESTAGSSSSQQAGEPWHKTQN